MAYLLIIPICLYTFLAAFVLQRPPRGASNLALAAYLLSAAGATGAYLALGTTTHRSTAEIASVLIVLLSSWSFIVLLPLTLLGLYFESWLRLHWRPLLLGTSAVVVAADAVLFYAIASSSAALVVPVQTGFWLHWLTRHVASSWEFGFLVLALSQVPIILVAGAALYTRRMTYWYGTVAFTLASVLSVLLPLISPATGEAWCVTVAALSFVAPVLLLTTLVIRAMREIPLETLITSHLNTYSDGVILIDGTRRVIWKNSQVMRWLGHAPPGAIASTHLFELLRGTALLEPIHTLLDSRAESTECRLALGQDEYVLQISTRPLDHVRQIPEARLLLFHDITASQIRRDLAEQRQELLALSAISADIFSSLEVGPVVDRALEKVLAITRLDDAAVYLIDAEEPSRLKLAAKLITAGDSGAAPAELSLEDPMCAQVLQAQQVSVTPDARQSAVRGPHLLARGRQAGATVPLVARERVLGVLQIASKQPHHFDATEVALLESVGRQLAVAMDNARLHSEERRQRQVAEALREVASSLSSLSLDDGLAALLKHLVTVIPYHRATVLLMAEPGSLNIRASAGISNGSSDPAALKAVRIDTHKYPYLLRLFEQHQPQIVPNTEADSEWVPGEHPYGSWMAAPLLIHDQVLGCLSITHTQPGFFTRHHLQIAQSFASQAVIAIENARLFETEQHRRVQAELLQHASYELVTSPDLDTALAAVLNNLQTILHFDRAHIGLIDEGGETWTPRASYPVEESMPRRSVLLSDYPLIQGMIDKKKALIVSDTRQDAGWRRGKHSQREVRCWIGAPLVVRDRMIGILNLDAFEPHRFSEDHLQTVQLFANQAAAAIENFQLFEEAGRQNRALRALNTVLAASNEALTQDNLLNVSLERVLETLSLSGGTIHQRDPRSQCLLLRASVGIPADVAVQVQRIPVGPLPVVALPPGEGYSFVSVPLVSHGAEIGLLSIYQPQGAPINAELRRLLASIGQQLGVVMDNASLFEETLRREALSTDLGRLSLAISAQLDRDTVLSLICRESIAVFNAQGAYVWLIEGDHLVGVAAHGRGDDQFKGQRCALSETTLLPVRVLREWRPEHVNHVADSTALSPDFLSMTQAKAAIAVPLLKGNIPIGVLLLVNTEDEDAFADWLAEQIGLLGVQAALSIQNATLFDEIRRRLDHLRLVNEVGRYATAILSLQGLIEGVARKLSDILHFDLISLLQVEEDRLFLHSVFVQSQGVPPEQLGERYTPIRGVAGEAVRRAEPVLENRQRGAEYNPDKQGGAFACCSLAVPLIIADEVIGVLLVERRQHDSITQEDLDVLEPLAAQLAISVSNARLFEKVRQQTVELEARVNERTNEIRRQQERTEAILRSVADAVIVFDLSYQVVLTNPVAKDLFDQHDLDMNLGGRIRDLVARTLAAQRGADDSTEVIELGPVTLQAKAARVVEGERELGSVVVLRDISRFQELDRLRDNFVSHVSHELRTPLANLKLYLSLLQQGRPEKRAAYMEVMEREIVRLERLINDLLEISRLQGEQRAERPQIRQPVNLEALINTVVHDNLARAESLHEELVHECLSSPLPSVSANPDQLVRALTNLIGNAISYSPEGARIRVRSQLIAAQQEQPESVMIEVIDNGIGIPASELPEIFKRFYRGSNVSHIPGTGLGLAIIKEIVELHGGSIEVESEQDRGSTFRLKLPVSSVPQ